MRTMRVLRAILLAAGLATGAAQAGLEVANTLRNTDGEALAGILVHAKPQQGNSAEAQITRTDSEGAFSFSLADGAWFVEVDPAELLELGYFCVPGWNPEWPIEPLVAVPLRPRLDYDIAENKVTVVATFDWMAGLEPTVLRDYRIERSEDGVKWDSMGTITLADPPVMLPDPNAKVPRCFYRAIDLGTRLVGTSPTR